MVGVRSILGTSRAGSDCLGMNSFADRFIGFLVSGVGLVPSVDLAPGDLPSGG